MVGRKMTDGKMADRKMADRKMADRKIRDAIFLSVIFLSAIFLSVGRSFKQIWLLFRDAGVKRLELEPSGDLRADLLAS